MVSKKKPRRLISRQQSWQVFKNQKGLCRIDGKHPLYRSGVCVEHYVRDYYCRRFGLTRDTKTVQIVCKALVNATRYGYRVGHREAATGRAPRRVLRSSKRIA